MDVTASDIIGAYVQKEAYDSQLKVKQLEQQAATQQRTLHQPVYETMQDAVRNGYGAPQSSYWDRIPKPLLYGSLALLGGALLIQAAKS